ncbi:hypothetical protein BH20ACT3_BH20ACT3_02230 [soil metagenome]
MTSWTNFQLDAPDLAERAQTILASTTNAVLGTLRANGSPRLSGIDPSFVEGEWWIGSMVGARKGADLRRDPRLALHAIPWESRRPKEGHDPGDGDAKLTGRGVLVTDPEALTRVFGHTATEAGSEPPTGVDLFRIDVESVVTVHVVDDQLVIDRWSTAEGRRTVRRT